MRVKELIKALEKCPQNSQVYIITDKLTGRCFTNLKIDYDVVSMLVEISDKTKSEDI